jgi:hypothetical protein
MIKILRALVIILLMILSGNNLFCQSDSTTYTAEQPDLSTPITNGWISDMYKDGNTMYVAGYFSHIGPNTGYGVCTDLIGNLLPGAFPRVEGKINAAVLDGAGGIFIGGSFTKVGEVSVNGFAHLDATGKLIPVAVKFSFSEIKTLNLKDGVLYVGGSLTATDGNYRRVNFAALEATTCSLLPFSEVEASVNSAYVTGNTIYLTGSFPDGVRTYDLNTGKKVNWLPEHDGDIRKVFSRNGKFYLCGSFTKIGAEFRNHIVEIDSATQQITPFNPKYSNIKTAEDILVNNHTVYAVLNYSLPSGSPRTVLKAFDLNTGDTTTKVPEITNTGFLKLLGLNGDNITISGEFTVAGTTVKKGLAIFNTLTGAIQPSLDVKINGLANYYISSGNKIFIGGTFNSFGGEYRTNIAAYDMTTKKIKPLSVNMNGLIFCVVVSKGIVYLSGSYTKINSVSRNNVAAVDTLGNVTSFDLGNPDLYPKLEIYKGRIYIYGQVFSAGDRAYLYSVDENTWQEDWSANGIIGSQINDIEFVDDVVYAVGTFQLLDSIRYNIAAFNLKTGRPTAWKPRIPGTFISSITYGNQQLYISGDFDTIAKQYHPKIAALNLVNGKPTAWVPKVNIGGYEHLTFHDNILYSKLNKGIISNGASYNLLCALDAQTGQLYSWLSKKPSILYSDLSVRDFRIIDNSFYIFGGNDYFFKHSVSGIIKLPLANAFTNYVNGSIYIDSVTDCKKQIFEKPLSSMILISQPSTSFVSCDSNGLFKMGFNDSIAYSMKPVIPKRLVNLFGASCPDDYHFTLDANSPSDTSGYDFGFIPKLCPILRVNISSSSRRRCTKHITTVHYINEGFSDVTGTMVHVKFPKLVLPLSANQSFTWDLTDSSIIFNIGTVNAGSSGSISIIDSIPCVIGITGLTQCTKAWITPFNDCYNALDSAIVNWDHSMIEISGVCLPGTGTVRFKIKNTGTGDMQTAKQYRLFANGVLQQVNFFKLKKNDSITVDYFADGASVWLATDQTAGNPTSKHPVFAIEGCVSTNSGIYTTGYLNDVDPDDDGLERETDCREITDSHDPNLKSVSPEGSGTFHVVEPTTLLNYHIDFQNTGTDTAYKVVVVDSLSPYLDIATLEAGASSYPYTLSISGKINPILKFTFDRINLTDSISDELHSHGFVEFKIAPKAGTPMGSRIDNAANIFFDYNEAVVTNTAWVTIDTVIMRKEQLVDVISQPVIEPGTCQGDSVWIVASFSGKGIKKYQWYKNDTLIKDQTDSVLIIHSLNFADDGAYSCKTSGYINTVTTNKVNLVCKKLPHAVITQNAETLSANTGYLSYQWFLNGVAIQGAITHTYQSTLNGKYTLQVADANGCTGISDVIYMTSSNDILILPNPANDYVVIETADTPMTLIRFYSANGQLVYTLYPEGSLKNQISLLNFSKGVYFVECYKGEDVKRYKLVKY